MDVDVDSDYGVVTLTGWQVLDPVIAIAVAANIVWSGTSLVRRSILGLMDTAISAEDQEQITKILDSHAAKGVRYHDLRTRQSGAQQFITVHVLVPGRWNVQRGHDLLEAMESEIRAALPRATVSTHLEPVEDPVAWEGPLAEREDAPKQG